MSGNSSLILAIALAAALLSCAECERSGCSALTRVALPQGASIAGVVAEASDVVSNDCQECPFGDATIEVWRTDSPIVDESAAIALTGERAADSIEPVSGQYRLVLDPGEHLLCVRPSCIAVTVFNDTTSTVNIKRRDGLTGFFVGSSERTALEEDFGFEVGF